MSKVVNRILTEQLGGRHAEDFIGRPGDLFYDAQSGQLRIGDGATVGGHSITESSPIESIFIGDWVYFVRPDNQPDVVDKIADNLWIKRDPQGESGSLFNAAPDGEGTLDGGGYVSTPYGTQWNTDGWQDLTNVKTRYYQNFTPSFSGGGWATPKHEWIMHDTQNDKYYAIRFLTWDSGNNDATGAFSYMRREINANVFFDRQDTNDQQEALNGADWISPNLAITRGNGEALFNYGYGDVTSWTTFDPVSNYTSGITYYPTGVVAFDTPTGDLLTALTQLQVGDTVSIDATGNGDASNQTVVTPYDATSMTIKLDWGPDPEVTPTFIVMNFTYSDHLEASYNNDESPKNTLWNSDGLEDLSNLMSRQFVLFDDLFAGNNIGKRILGKEYVMWDTIADEYYAITFTRWQQGSDWSYPGFSYIRRKIDVNKLTSGLKFNDGTVQTTAYSDNISGVLKQSPRLASQVTRRYITPSDVGRTIYLNSATTATEIYIPDGGAVDFQIGATITIINRTGSSVYLYKDNDDENGTIYGAGTSSSSTSWEIPDAGGGNICTLMKIETGMDNFFNDWMLSGANITTA